MGRREIYLGERGLRDLLLVDGYSQGGCQLAEVLGRFSFSWVCYSLRWYIKSWFRARAQEKIIVPLFCFHECCDIHVYVLALGLGFLHLIK
jgi:hypothetical protein